jgi:hypothetical protein
MNAAFSIAYRTRLACWRRRNPWDSGVPAQNEDYPWIWTQDDEARMESSFRRDAETSTRDACVTSTRNR